MILQQIGREEDQEGQRRGARRSKKNVKEEKDGEQGSMGGKMLFGTQFEGDYYRPK